MTRWGGEVQTPPKKDDIIYEQPFTPNHLPLIIYYLPLITYHLTLITDHQKLTINYLQKFNIQNLSYDYLPILKDILNALDIPKGMLKTHTQTDIATYRHNWR